jgi:DNA-binding transcriptional regulator GbsR (MarR family)
MFGMPDTSHAIDVFADGMGAAAATSGILSQLQGRNFGVLYLADQPLSLDEIAAALGQSKSNVSITIRGLVEWHLVRRVPTPGSRKDHYEATTDFVRAMQELVERRFRWCVRQALSAAKEAERLLDRDPDARARFAAKRLDTLRSFFAALDAGFSAFTDGKPLDPAALVRVIPLPATARRK